MLISGLQRKLSAAQASAQAVTSLLPAIASGQFSDPASLREHLVGQLGRLQAQCVEVTAERAAAQAEVELLR